MAQRGAHRSRRRAGQGGFTLVELLVVIVILGILSAVVVFAVRGSGDKGSKAAVATDARIIRTALETYCARNGHYPKPNPDQASRSLDEMGVLVEEKFLSNRSEYNKLATDNGLLEGNCPGTPQHYSLTGPPPVPGSAGWKSIVPPLKGVLPFNDRNLVRLPDRDGEADGRIFTGGEIYDPKAGSNGDWKLASRPVSSWNGTGSGNGYPDLSDGADISNGDYPITMTPIAGDPALCGVNCGKVLALVVYLDNYQANWNRLQDWELYDPRTASDPSGIGKGPAGRVGQWTTAGIEGDKGGDHTDVTGQQGTDNARSVQILGSSSECASTCGKVLVASGSRRGSMGQPGTLELWDPLTNRFAPIGAFPSSGAPPTLQVLPRGQVLLVDGSTAWIFDPTTAALLPLPPPPSPHSDVGDEAATFGQEGAVMITSNSATRSNWSAWKKGIPPLKAPEEGPEPGPQMIDIFTPASSGIGGGWSSAPGCGDTRLAAAQTVQGYSYYEKYCHILSSLSDGGLLAWTEYERSEVDSQLQRSEAVRPLSYEGRTYMFKGASWARTADFQRRSTGFERFDPGPPATIAPGTNMPAGGILVTGASGTCGSNCNKVLAVNNNRCYCYLYQPVPSLTAELYTSTT